MMILMLMKNSKTSAFSVKAVVVDSMMTMMIFNQHAIAGSLKNLY